MTEKRKPSLVRMIQSDYLVLLGILIPVVSLIMYIAVAYFGYFPGLRGHDPIQGGPERTTPSQTGWRGRRSFPKKQRLPDWRGKNLPKRG